MKKIFKATLFLSALILMSSACGSASDKKNDAVVDATDSTAVAEDEQPNTGCD
ncbi:hypothetical protein [Sphingobacterium chungjuense]|uniref:hypothetical protein n=1 Tax=Sphingobacterium chungjuense TaxID=2675553 RepID=UPI001408E56D|nr:hypothetical protein [Sphingobacterium chungjuense]